MNNDYSLLRPFDAEKAKAGEPICHHSGTPRKLVAGPDTEGKICVEDLNACLMVAGAECYRMVPLAWVEGKPVYKGDVLYWNANTPEPGTKFVVAGTVVIGHTDRLKNTDGEWVPEDELTWTPPAPKVVKHQRWVNLYADGKLFHWDNEEDADKFASPCRVECRLIEWEVKS